MRTTPILAALLLVGCAAGHEKGGLSEPGLMTDPRSYLATVGLETHTRDDVLRVLGPPDKTIDSGGRTMWTYFLSEDGARRRYVYIFDGDQLYNVQYEESGLTGPLDGLTAREVQSE